MPPQKKTKTRKKVNIIGVGSSLLTKNKKYLFQRKAIYNNNLFKY